MAFYKYGFMFLAGTGFGAAMSSLRRDGRCLHRRHCCHPRHRDVAAAADESETWEREKEERYMQMQENKRGLIKCPKGGEKEKRAKEMDQLD